MHLLQLREITATSNLNLVRLKELCERNVTVLVSAGFGILYFFVFSQVGEDTVELSRASFPLVPAGRGGAQPGRAFAFRNTGYFHVCIVHHKKAR